MDIKLIMEFKSTGGDCISHFDAKFETNPTLEEFVDWLLTKQAKEWGYVFGNNFCIEYRWVALLSCATTTMK